ncbi:MAG: type 4a pilus biogenesis protein PilO [Candidatus Omnitrophota bacterium]|jgi:Tfp pilus assembly protein PilO
MKIKKIDVEKKNWNKLVIFNVVMIAAALTVSIVFIYMPFSERNKSIRTDILKERDRNVLIGKIKALGKHLKVYDKRIHQGTGVSWLLGEISGMASKENIEISSIKPGNPEDYGLYTKLFVIVDITSNYNQFGRFIAAIESSEKFMKVESVNVKRMDLDDKFENGSGKFRAFDVKANIVISTIVPKE